MFRFLIVAAVVGVATPAAAQVDPVSVGQGAVLSTTMRAHSSRIVARGGSGRRMTHSEIAQICVGNLPRYRREYGPTHPKVRKIESLCAQAER